ncbi:MAG: DNA polymerase III subunit gamma/tau [Spirochaetes bacterium]|jgi:DNA polymerase-3 subunit gamma/tau|nr:DNA polymerase III subunit gamma/tau [Spirochaetota bacterium]
MSYQVIARKWRPQTFDEVVYQDHISKTLKNSIENARISHAYLFAGPRGVGKTTMARILAKALNCVHGPTSKPCGVCDNCVEIKNGGSFDVIEIDGASNRGIEDIRELRENVNFAPLKSKYKIYIIDEVHMLTREAFNALLKTLEEPPAHIVFIFATTEMHQIPETILSRCQKFFFKKMPVDVIVAHLMNIITREGYRVSEQALYSVARAADGSMRDAQSLLDQTMSFSGRGAADSEIGEEDALAILGVVSLDSYSRITGSICDGDAPAAMGEIERITSLGVDVPRYAAGLIDVIRIMRLIRNRVQVQDMLGLSAGEMDWLADYSSKFFDEELGMFFRIASDLQSEMKFSTNERINLEMAVLDMISVRKMPSVASIIGKLEEMKPGEVPQSAGPNRRPAGKGAAPASPGPSPDKEAVPRTVQSRDDKLDEKAVLAQWNSLVNGMQNDRQYLHFILKPSRISYSDGAMHIKYPGGSDHSYYRKILDAKNISYITEEMRKRLGREIRIIVGTDGPEKSKPDEKKPSEPARGTDEPVPPPEAEMLKQPELDEYDKVDPTVEKIKNVFHGQIIEKGEK